MPSGSAARARRAWRWLPAVALAAVLSAALHGQSVPEGTWLAFDVPDGRRPTAYVVGYFPDATSLTPLVTYRVAAQEAAAAGAGSVRLPLRGFRPPSGSSVVVRVRSVAGRKESAWSEPTGVIAADEIASLQPQVSPQTTADGAPPLPATSAGEPAAGTARAAARDKGADSDAARAERAARAVEARVREDQTLRKALTDAFPGVDLDAAVTGYQKLENFVGALHAARSLDIPLASLKPDTTGRRTRLEAAIQRLKPSADAKKEARKARQAARKLIKDARGTKGNPPAGADKA